MRKNKMQSITAHNLRKLCHYVHHSWLIILVALILFLSSFKDFSTFCFKSVCCYKILDEVCKKDVMLNLNGEAGYHSISPLVKEKLCVEEQDYR